MSQWKPCKCNTTRLATKYGGSIVGWRCPKCKAEWPCNPVHPGNWIKAKDLCAAAEAKATHDKAVKATLKASDALNAVSPAIVPRVLADAWLIAEARAAREQIQGNLAKPYKWTGRL